MGPTDHEDKPPDILTNISYKQTNKQTNKEWAGGDRQWNKYFPKAISIFFIPH
jgi:hypothetical protein